MVLNVNIQAAGRILHTYTINVNIFIKKKSWNNDNTFINIVWGGHTMKTLLSKVTYSKQRTLNHPRFSSSFIIILYLTHSSSKDDVQIPKKHNILWLQEIRMWCQNQSASNHRNWPVILQV